MTCSELIAALQAIIAQHGDLPIVGGEISDDQGPSHALVLDKAGSEFGLYKGGDHDTIAGVFLER